MVIVDEGVRLQMEYDEFEEEENKQIGAKEGLC
jgi:hypothetical protein